jgi:hypothetical protein
MSIGPSTRIPDSDFPAHGARARQWGRFERGLDAWLNTPHGRFAVWRAERMVAGAPPFCAQVPRHASEPVAPRQI